MEIKPEIQTDWERVARTIVKYTILMDQVRKLIHTERESVEIEPK